MQLSPQFNAENLLILSDYAAQGKTKAGMEARPSVLGGNITESHLARGPGPCY
jgi:hypothetical protein